MNGRYGSVSHGTLRTVDLIDACTDWLAAHEPDRYATFCFGWKLPPKATEQRPILEWLDRLASGPLDVLGQPMNAEGEMALRMLDEMLEQVSDTMSELAPEGYYFGSIEGDGSDFGFWPIDDGLI